MENSTYIFCPPSLKTLDPTFICLPSLKTLDLYRIILSDNASIPSLLSDCPLLEELSLSVYIGKNVGVIHIVALKLISLTIKFEPGPLDDDNEFSDYIYHVIIDTPTLKYLNLDDYEAQAYAVKNLNHLVEAEISFWNPSGDIELFYSKAITDFFGGISHIQSLSLAHSIRERTFRSFTQLQTLHLQGVDVRPFDDKSEPPTCFLTHLKRIRLVCIGRSKFEMEMIEYFLCHAKVLEKLTVLLSG